MVMRRKKDSKVVSKCSRAFFKGVRISVSRVSEYMPSTAEVTKKGMNDNIREDARQGATLPETNRRGMFADVLLGREIAKEAPP